MTSELTSAIQQDDFVDIITSSIKISPGSSATGKKACKLLGKEQRTERKVIVL